MRTTKQLSDKTTKFRFYWCSILAFAILSACESNVQTANPLPPIKVESKESFKVDVELARKVAMGFFMSDSTFLTGRKGKSTPKIREVSRVSISDSLDFEAFVVNESEGFVMISGDSRVMPILAFSSEGELNLEDLEDVNGLSVWYKETMNQIEAELEGIENVHPIVYNEWKNYTNDYDPGSRIWDNGIAYYPNTNC